MQRSKGVPSSRKATGKTRLGRGGPRRGQAARPPPLPTGSSAPRPGLRPESTLPHGGGRHRGRDEGLRAPRRVAWGPGAGYRLWRVWAPGLWPTCEGEEVALRLQPGTRRAAGARVRQASRELLLLAGPARVRRASRELLIPAGRAHRSLGFWPAASPATFEGWDWRPGQPPVTAPCPAPQAGGYSVQGLWPGRNAAVRSGPHCPPAFAGAGRAGRADLRAAGPRAPLASCPAFRR